MPKVEVNIDQILTSAISAAVEPGDKLLVMGGVVIGLVERPETPSPIEPEIISRATVTRGRGRPPGAGATRGGGHDAGCRCSE